MYGGADYLKNPLNNATQAIAQAGSTFKPFALAAAVQAGIALDSQWPGNSPHTVNGYTFQNYANTSYGPSVSLLQGTENSINSVYVEVENRVGVTAVRDMALRAGIPQTTTGWDTTDNLTFVLGTASPHTLDVANAYATFAARGVRATPTTLRRVGTADGRTSVHDDDHPRADHRREHRRPGQPRPAERRDATAPAAPPKPSADPSPARPGPPTTTCPHGSPDTPRNWPPRSPSARTTRPATRSRCPGPEGCPSSTEAATPPECGPPT